MQNLRFSNFKQATNSTPTHAECSVLRESFANINAQRSVLHAKSMMMTTTVIAMTMS